MVTPRGPNFWPWAPIRESSGSAPPSAPRPPARRSRRLLGPWCGFVGQDKGAFLGAAERLAQHLDDELEAVVVVVFEDDVVGRKTPGLDLFLFRGWVLASKKGKQGSTMASAKRKTKAAVKRRTP